jgi:oligosaccharide repeat unit polymerase
MGAFEHHQTGAIAQAMVAGGAQMRRILDLSRPDVLFAICWGGTLLLSSAVQLPLSVEPDSRVQWLICLNIASFFVIYALVSRMTSRRVRAPLIDVLQRGSWDERILWRFMRTLLGVWGVLWVVTIVWSGGLPVFWLLLGSGKTYVDFGVPTLTGLLNMMRAFVFSASILLYLRTSRPRYVWLPLFLLVTAVVEISRGGVLVLLAHGIGIVLLLRPLTVVGVVRLTAGAAFVVFAFGVLGEFRGTTLDTDALVGDQGWFQQAPIGVLFAFIYLVSPLNNLYYAADTINPTYTPYFTSETLFPTVIRTMLYPDNAYPVELKSASFNATTFYSPLLADYGWVGAALLVCLIQWVCAYVHVRARRGSYFYTLVYPPLFMSVLLSVFYMYFLSLVTVMYPVLVSIFKSYRRARLGRHRQALTAGTLAARHV